MDLPRTEAELVKFHNYLSEKGLMNERTAYSRSQAAVQVLSVFDEAEKTDLAAIDRDLAFRRFVNKNGQRFTGDSLDTYRHRFNAALDEFLSYARDQVGYRPSSAQRASGPRQKAGAAASNHPRPRMGGNTTDRANQELPPGLLAYPLVLPSGCVAQLLLPATLTTADANRIAAVVPAMVTALAVPEEAAKT